MTDTFVHVSELVGSPLLDCSGERLGRVEDLVTRLDDAGPLPPVTGLRARIGGRDAFVPITGVQGLEASAARASTTKLDLARFERRPGEVLLAGDVLDHSLIDVSNAHLVTAREVELISDGTGWRVAGIDPSLGLRLRRLLPHRLRGHPHEHRRFIAWTDLEPLVGHVPGSRLKLGARRLARLHPAQIADLVEAASHAEGEEILAAVGHDKELEADVFEELDDAHQVEFLRERPDPQVAAVLARMAGDDAADLLLELPQNRRLSVLELIPAAEQAKIRRLLVHSPLTAGGLMTPDFICASAHETVAAVLGLVRSSALGPQQISVVCLTGERGELVAAVSLASLVRARVSAPASDLVDLATPTVSASADLPQIAVTMADYDLIAIPVVDAQACPIGIVTVDDVLAQIVPDEWHHRTE